LIRKKINSKSTLLLI